MLSRPILLALIGLALSSPAGAAEPAPPAIDMTLVLHDEAGQPARDAVGQRPDDPDCGHCPPLTLGRAIAHALFAGFPDENVTAEQKWARALLAERLREAKAARLDADETAVVKRLLGRAYGGVVLMQAYPLLDPNAQPPAVK